MWVEGELEPSCKGRRKENSGADVREFEHALKVHYALFSEAVIEVSDPTETIYPAVSNCSRILVLINGASAWPFSYTEAIKW